MATETVKITLKGLLNAWLSPSGEIVVDADDFEGQALTRRPPRPLGRYG